MLIDWFTVGAQVLNFLVLVWLMKRFLYKPVLQAIDSREKQIATTLSDARALETEAHRERDEFDKKNVAFDVQRDALLTKAKEEAQTERSRLLEEARKESDAASKARRQSLIDEQQSLNAEITLRARNEVFAIARKTLSDLAEASLEEEMVAVFVRRLRASSPKELEMLKLAFHGKEDRATVSSTFTLSVSQEATIKKVIQELFEATPDLHFESTPDTVSGIELVANGRKIGWSISEYLDSLEKGVSELLKTSPKNPVGSQ